MKRPKNPPKCQACKYAVKIPGKRGLMCGHASSMGEYSATEARRYWRWLEMLTFRNLCGTVGAFFEPKADRKRPGRKPNPVPAVPATPLPGLEEANAATARKEGEE